MVSSPFRLRDHQVHILQEIQAGIQEVNSLLTTAPTGAGKMVIIAEIMARARRKNQRAALLVHRQELVDQACEKIHIQSGYQPGVVWQSRREWDQPSLVLAQSSLLGHEIPDHIKGIPILLVDEAHHSVAPTWLETIDIIRPRYLLGFSATPFRQDREPLFPIPFAKIIRPVTPQELIEQDVLCRAVIESPIVHDGNGDLQPINQASNIVDIYTQAVRYAIAQGRSRILLYVSSTRDHPPSRIIARTTRALTQAGIANGSITENLTETRRRHVFNKFQDSPGAAVLVNYMTLTEGVDLPYVDCVIIGRHTDSESTIIQMIGRGLRKHPAKQDCLVLDYTGRLDMDDIIHYWRLDGAKASKDQPKRENLLTLSHRDLLELAAEFPSQLSPLDNTRFQYPWFTPFPGRPLLALALWSGRDDPSGYVTVEPSKNGGWNVTRITLLNKGPSPVRRTQTVAASPQEAANLVRIAIGEHAPRIERSAPWRLAPASQAQKKTWQNLHHQPDAPTDRLTSGEASDAIALKRFQHRVDPKLL